MKRTFFLSIFLASLCLAGCGSDLATLPDGVLSDTVADVPATDATVDAGDLPGDAASDAVPADATPADATPADATPADVAPADPGPDTVRDAIVPGAYIPAKSFRFEPAGRDGTAFLVDVVARDLGEVFGIALRVEFDPARLDVADVAFEPALGADGSEAYYKWAPVRTGSVALGLTLATYSADTTMAGDVKLARLKVVPKGTEPAELSFFTNRCLVVTNRLEKVDATYLKATVYP